MFKSVLVRWWMAWVKGFLDGPALNTFDMSAACRKLLSVSPFLFDTL